MKRETCIQIFYANVSEFAYVISVNVIFDP